MNSVEQNKLNELKSKVFSSFFWNLLEKGGSQAIALIVQIVLARLLAPSDFGMMAIMVVFINVGNVLVQSGLNTAIIQKEQLETNDMSTAFWMSFAIAAALYILLFFASPLIAEFYSIPSLVAPLRVLCLVFITNSLYSIQVALITREFQFKKIFKATITAITISGASGIAISALGGGIWGLVFQQLLYSIISAIMITLQTKWLPCLSFRTKSARELYGFGWKLLVSGVIDTIYDSASDLIVGKQFSVAQLGFFNQGKKYPQALGATLDATIQPIMLSTVSRVQSSIEDAKGIVRRALKSASFVIMPTMTYAAIAAPSLISLLLGDQWLPAVPYFQAFCIIYAFLPIHSTNLQAINALGRSDWFLKLEIIKKSYGLLVLLFTAFVIKDIDAICIGLIATNIISTFVNAYPNRKLLHYPYKEQLLDLLPIIFCTSMSAFAGTVAPIAFFPEAHPLFCAILQFLIMGGAFILLSCLFKVDTLQFMRDELRRIKKSKSN